jgi:hypothetical protein
MNLALCAQDKDSFFRGKDPYFMVNGGYNIGIGSIRFNDDLSLRNTGRLYRLRLSGGFQLDQRLMLGIGAGLEAYHQPDFNFLPIAFEGRYFLTTKANRPFLGAGAGYSIKLSESFKSGICSGINVGCSLGKGRRTPLLIGAGLDLHQARNTTTYIFHVQTQRYEYIHSNLWLKSFTINVALLFD